MLARLQALYSYIRFRLNLNSRMYQGMKSALGFCFPGRLKDSPVLIHPFGWDSKPFGSLYCDCWSVMGHQETGQIYFVFTSPLREFGCRASDHRMP